MTDLFTDRLDHLTTASSALNLRAALQRERLARIARHWTQNPAMASPPTVTTGTTTPTGMTFYDARTSPVFRWLGALAFQTSGVFRRVQTVTQASAGNLGGTASSHGFAVAFVVDASSYVLAVSQSAGPITLEHDGVVVSTSGVTGPGGVHPNPGFITVDLGSRRTVSVKVNFRAGAWGLAGVYCTATGSIWSPPVAQKRLLTFGDSMATGTGADLGGASWNRILGEMLGYDDVISCAIGGTGFSNNGTQHRYLGHIDDITLANADAILLPASVNDGSFVGTTLQADALATMQAARVRAPRAPIIVTGVILGKTTSDTNNENAVKAAFDQWADPNSVWLPCRTDPQGPHIFGTGRVGATTGDGNADLYVGTDGTHPPLAGHAYQARRLANLASVLPI